MDELRKALKISSFTRTPPTGGSGTLAIKEKRHFAVCKLPVRKLGFMVCSSPENLTKDDRCSPVQGLSMETGSPEHSGRVSLWLPSFRRTEVFHN